jgi:GTPase SAR1 family protein
MQSVTIRSLTDEDPSKIVLLGAEAVGKSAIAARFLGHTFPETHEQTLEDAYIFEAEVPGMILKRPFELIDTGGSSEYSALREIYLRNGHAFLVVYAVDDRDSFIEAESLIRMLHAAVPGPRSSPRGGADSGIILCANKAELDEDKHAVSHEEGRRLSKELKCSFLELSAKDDDAKCKHLGKATALVRSSELFEMLTKTADAAAASRRPHAMAKKKNIRTPVGRLYRFLAGPKKAAPAV